MNAGTFVLLIALVSVVVLIIMKMKRDKSACVTGCSGYAVSDKCLNRKNDDTERSGR